MRRLLYLAILCSAFGLGVLTARAGETAPSPKPPPGTSVDMPILIAPLIVDGKLTAYAYVSSTIVATSAAAAIEVRSRTPFIQDAYVRDVNGKPIGKAAAPDQLDSAGLSARLLADARRIAGAGSVASVQLTQVQISPLRPGAGG